MATTLPNTRFHRVLLAVGVGASIMAAEFFGEFLVRYALKTGWREPGIALASNSVAGAVGSLLVYKLLSFEAERQRLRRELNHQIRNALQPILYCTYKLDGVKKQVIEASVQQIQICLNESLLTETREIPDVRQAVH
ncbi:MAG TPA: hypothetical protein VE734_13305 [Terriglobales bacterium]|nr:hypothetical protein [Terriglobales bacterium]